MDWHVIGRLVTDWSRIDIRLATDWRWIGGLMMDLHRMGGLAMDWRMIGARLMWLGRIDTGLAQNWH